MASVTRPLFTSASCPSGAYALTAFRVCKLLGGSVCRVLMGILTSPKLVIKAHSGAITVMTKMGGVCYSMSFYRLPHCLSIESESAILS
ncbi:hypothetical protein RRG08_014641 [Elysia crispata]|uniref:Uncharacterized protein n=1 Tax=Elysia crispata TaxID=231223 RepID=A0AAE0YHJ7_9GAST|nr:hypothetical protein RRG08_014641 [Elysia crispata]